MPNSGWAADDMASHSEIVAKIQAGANELFRRLQECRAANTVLEVGLEDIFQMTMGHDKPIFRDIRGKARTLIANAAKD